MMMTNILNKPVITGHKSFFPDLLPVKFEGQESKNPLSYRFYQPHREVFGKKLKDWLKPSLNYWEQDPNRPWHQGRDAMARARYTMDAFFEFASKLGFEQYCFHDYDLIEQGSSFAEYEKNLQGIGEYAKTKQELGSFALLCAAASSKWPKRFKSGFPVLACNALRAKNTLDLCKILDARFYGFLDSCDLEGKSLARAHLAELFRAVQNYAKKIDFKGELLLFAGDLLPDISQAALFLKQHNLHSKAVLMLQSSEALRELLSLENEELAGLKLDGLALFNADLLKAALMIMQNQELDFGFSLELKALSLNELALLHIRQIDAMARAFLMAEVVLETTDYLKQKKARADELLKDLNLPSSLEDLRRSAYELGLPRAVLKEEGIEEGLLGLYV